MTCVLIVPASDGPFDEPAESVDRLPVAPVAEARRDSDATTDDECIFAAASPIRAAMRTDFEKSILTNM